MLLTSRLEQYREAILSLPGDRPLTREELLTGTFRLHREGRVEVYYAPHGEYVNPAARLVIIGITPGWTQMELAFRTARRLLGEGVPLEETARLVKREARFAGGMRRNLEDMLEGLGLPRLLGVPDAAALFGGDGGEGEALLHTTSMLRDPVFAGGRNYTGHSPALPASPFLLEVARASLAHELPLLRRPLIVPLGKIVEAVLRHMAEDGFLDSGQVLWGFPHPSGANGHRHAQFAGNREPMQAAAEVFFGGG
ncbi:uracil-DNA glycosylase family protein [Paenibacillus caseinilyticus]|uniref:Uracil-DNA glycosylase-like domain-containing protein n=1 Tax=Paenibacillus mucilaginosus K02 TaxID=997761 RepID=I0BV81_9BACL|nr:hypothetical protein [Paenibacillus mucilaginosus]AFH66278.1 hypothetical protein B2K_37225 [Paenibacillus mucilaginosus K02]